MHYRHHAIRIFFSSFHWSLFLATVLHTHSYLIHHPPIKNRTPHPPQNFTPCTFPLKSISNLKTTIPATTDTGLAQPLVSLCFFFLSVLFRKLQKTQRLFATPFFPFQFKSASARDSVAPLFPSPLHFFSLLFPHPLSFFSKGEGKIQKGKNMRKGEKTQQSEFYIVALSQSLSTPQNMYMKKH